MKRFWIKLEMKTLSDPVMGQLPNYLWRRVIELFMLAGGNGDDGLLQPVPDLAWQLHTSVTDMDNSLRKLAELGVVNETPQGWVVVGFKESQASTTSTQRVQEYRKRIRSRTSMGRKRIDEEINNEINNETDDETTHGTNDELEEELDDEIENGTEVVTEEETGEETEEKRSSSPSSSNSNSNSFPLSVSDSDPDFDAEGDEVQEKGETNAFTLYEDNIGRITPMLADALRADITEFSEAWVCDAILEAVRSNAYSLKYAEAILRRWQRDGRRTRKNARVTRKPYRQPEEDDGGRADRQRYVTGKYKDWIIH